ncbi:MFS transporter [Streptosporangium sp. NPDC006013]|uniref:MFS transporter n=1 Tax=Streptosporangium sp. NPDC006013 TaxID=3155596 RepID=UPI0033AC1A73
MPGAPVDSAGFRRLWLAALASGIGDGMRLTALPLLAATAFPDRPYAVALVTAMGTLPWLLFGLLAGVVVDRVDRRRLMWATDGVRAALATVFVLFLFDTRNLAVLCGFAFVIATAHTLFSSASGAYLPTLVPSDGLTRANGRLMSVQVISVQLVGPALAGFLFARSAELPFAVDAASFLVSSLLILTLRPPPAPLQARSFVKRPLTGSELVLGLQWLFRHPALRAQSVLLMMISMMSGIFLAVLVLYTTHTLHLGSSGYGLLIAMLAVGGVLGSFLAPLLRAKLSDQAMLTLSAASVALSAAVIGAVPNVVAAGTAVAAFGMASMVWNVVTVSIRQRYVPNELLGRTTSASRMLNTGAVPLGALISVPLANTVPPRALFLGAALVIAVVSAVCHRSLGVPLDSTARAVPSDPPCADAGKRPADSP